MTIEKQGKTGYKWGRMGTDVTIQEQIRSSATVLCTTWVGPEPTFIPLLGRYICAAPDGDKLRELIDRGLLPMPGICPGSGAVSLAEMLEYGRVLRALNPKP